MWNNKHKDTCGHIQGDLLNNSGFSALVKGNKAKNKTAWKHILVISYKRPWIGYSEYVCLAQDELECIHKLTQQNLLWTVKKTCFSCFLYVSGFNSNSTHINDPNLWSGLHLLTGYWKVFCSCDTHLFSCLNKNIV